MSLSFINIDKMYEDNRAMLLEDDTYRPCKSVTRDVEATVNRFASYYKANSKTVLEESDILAICGADVVSDTTNTNVRVMREFGFVEVLSAGKYRITQKFIDYINKNSDPGAFVIDMMYNISGKNDLIMYSNLILCTLREGYKYGKIIAFPDSDQKFKNIVHDASMRYEYRKRVYDIYGFSGRNLTPEDDTYTPNANYRVLTTLKNLNLIKPSSQENGLNTFELTSNAIHLLKTIDDSVGSGPSQSGNDEANVFAHDLYGMHIKLRNDALSDTKPHICIGWSKMGDLSSITTREDLDARYESAYPNVKKMKKAQDLGQIWRFVKEMQIGDYVVFSNGDTCHIGRIVSDYYFDNAQNTNQDPDYVNVRDVEWLKKDIRKSDLSEVFQNSLGAAMSVFRLNDYKSAVNDLLNGTYVKDESLLIEEDIEIDADDIGKDYTVAELAEILSDMYDAADNKTTAIHMFGFKYAAVIISKGYTATQIVKASRLQDSYHVEVNKGISIYKSVKDNEYGIHFHEPEEVIQATDFDYKTTIGSGINKIFFGTPGCGKSYHIEHGILGKDKVTKEYVGSYSSERVIRTTFYQDYSNTDFVGQILPKVVKGRNGEKDTVEYIFNPGPFTLALIQAISNPTKKVALIIEEINRGNAPAIFGDIFQLLDRDENGISEYGIVNVSMMDYLNAYEFTVDGEKKRYTFSEIKIPGNMDIFATMNTSDQNVYTLDTAFVRRWDKEKIRNSFTNCTFKAMPIPGMPQYTWEEFVTSINKCIASHLEDLQVNEDKQIGAFFVKENLLAGNDAEKFAYKVFDYLWSDVAKLDHGIFFNHFDTLESLIDAYKKNGVGVFKTGIFEAKATVSVEEEGNNE